MLLPAVLHPDVVDYLRSQNCNDLATNVWKCIYKLRTQQFDGGLRVKKLQGAVKTVWEARIQKASRLVFTYTTSRLPNTGERQTYIAVQDICIDHDDVFRTALRARKKTSDAQWLSADVLETIGNLDKNQTSLSAKEKNILNDVLAKDLQTTDDPVDELLDNVQWCLVDSEQEWLQAIINKDIDLPLKLTPEEYEVVETYGNILLSGNAGTGKTTVGLHRLVKSLEILPPGKRLYIAYNPILVKEAQKQFNRLVNPSVTSVNSTFDFKTIQAFCQEILKKAGQSQTNFENLADYHFFERLYQRPERQQYPPALVWDEIRSLIKGAQLITDKKMLSKEDYKGLGRKRSSVIPYKKRDTIYGLASWYQKKLEEYQCFDEIDLARQVLSLVQQGQGQRYQLIVCDEVQDLTELQLQLLTQLITKDGQLFFTGDLNQMISPSGFRWEDLKTKFFHQERSFVQKSLKFNFRSVGSLANLANQILLLRSRLLSECLEEPIISLSSHGQLPRLINAGSEKIRTNLQHINPNEAIIVRNEEDKKRLSEDLKSSLIFTIEEAKGLEFDTVFLVDFFSNTRIFWQKVLNPRFTLTEQDTPQLKLELNLLYVGITRARRILNIWQNQLNELWSQQELINCVELIQPESVRDDRIEPTPQLWRERGFYYLETGFYRQAVECFEKAGEFKLQTEAWVKLLIQERQYQQAAESLIELGSREQAAQLFEKAMLWEKAAKCWGKVDNTQKQQECEIYHLETLKKWEEAAQRWESLNRFEDALRCREKTNSQTQGKSNNKKESYSNNKNSHKESIKSNFYVQQAYKKNMLESVSIEGKPILSIHLYLCEHIKLFNHGFCQIKTENQLITFWQDKPFEKTGYVANNNRKWTGRFTQKIVNGKLSKCSINFSMKQVSGIGQSLLDIFELDNIVSLKVGFDLPPENIPLQVPITLELSNDEQEKLSNLLKNSELYSNFWQTLKPEKSTDTSIVPTDKSNISEQKNGAKFTILNPFIPDNYINYPPVNNNLKLAKEGMKLVNTGFFNKAVTSLINKEGSPVETLKTHGIILYMGTDSKTKIIDAACGLATWKPFEMSYYAGEQRYDLNTLITNTFNPIIEAIQKFRVDKKQANISPCLTLLCLVHNQSTGVVCEFRSHYTAELGSQLIIPGFISKNPSVERMRLDVLGKPQNIPIIKGFF